MALKIQKTRDDHTDQDTSPVHLDKLLSNGRDPRPDKIMVQRVLNHIAYFASEGQHHKPRVGIGPIWGAFLWNMQLRQSLGVFPGAEWKEV